MRTWLLLFLLCFAACGDPGEVMHQAIADSAPAPSPVAVQDNDDERGDKQHPAEHGKSEFCQQEAFAGKSRAQCKTSIAEAKPESFPNLDALWKTIPSDAFMAAHQPKISDDENSERVKEEERNVQVKKAWLLAVKREDDGDFHLIIGNKPSAKADVLFNAEISGLPAKEAESMTQLLNVRNDFKTYFRQHTCFHNYKKFYDKPIEISISGSLFYDVEHMPPNGSVGPKDLKTGTAWEMHPVTEIIFR